MNSYTASAVGTYSLVVTDKNGCVSLPVSVLVSEEPAPTLSLTGNNWFCTGRTTTLSGTVSGGTNPYTLQWQRNADLLATTTSLTVGTVGSYTLTAKDSRGCTVSSGISVSESTNPAPVIGGSASFCAGQASLLTATSNAGTGPFAINWQRDLNAVGTASPLSATAPGTYVTTITDAKGCVGTSAGFVVVQKDAPTALISVISGDLNLSPGGSVVLGTNNGTGLTYLWNKDGTPLTGVTSATYAANQAGVYTVIVSREGCTTTSVPTTVNLITATEPINAGLHLVVSPNPTDGPVQLQLYLTKPASATLHLTDILGRLVASWSFDKAVSEHKVRIDLPAGFYLLQAESDGGQVSQRLLVK